MEKIKKKEKAYFILLIILIIGAIVFLIFLIMPEGHKPVKGITIPVYDDMTLDEVNNNIYLVNTNEEFAWNFVYLLYDGENTVPFYTTGYISNGLCVDVDLYDKLALGVHNVTISLCLFSEKEEIMQSNWNTQYINITIE